LFNLQLLTTRLDFLQRQHNGHISIARVEGHDMFDLSAFRENALKLFELF
jgi:hypothetical protein